MGRDLYRLCVLAGIGGSTVSRDLWFGSSILKGHTVIAPDEDTAALIRRCFLEQFRQVLSDCEVRVGSISPEQPQAKPTKPLWKPGKEPKQSGLL